MPKIKKKCIFLPKDLQISLFLAIFVPAFDRSTLTRGERRHASLLCRSSASDANALPNAKGKLSEWSKEPHSKCGVRITSYRGFESLTFRKAESSGNRVICRNDKRKSNWASVYYWAIGLILRACSYIADIADNNRRHSVSFSFCKSPG